MLARDARSRDLWDSLLVVKEIVGHVITGVSKDTSTVDSGCRIPVIEEDGMRQLPERGRQDNQKRGRHHEPIPIHW